MQEYEDEIKLYKALMHPARLAILYLLREGEACVCEMEATFGFRQAYISQQLMVLRNAGLVANRSEGTNNYYRVIRPEIFKIMDALRQMTGKTPVHLEPVPVTCANAEREISLPSILLE